MRPVNKGKSPYQKIKSYEEATSYLGKRLGFYCSYCEMPIKNVPEVEHFIAKSQGGSETDWENLLLGCKYCNTRKKDKVTLQEAGEYLRPDCDNTALAYSYEHGIPQIAKERLLETDKTGSFYEKAQRLFGVVQLNHVPIPKEKDRRFHARNEAYQIAKESLQNWKQVKENRNEYTDIVKNQILLTAVGSGFFSVWMTVFSEEPEMLLAFIEKFPNTRTEYFDERGKVRFKMSQSFLLTAGMI